MARRMSVLTAPVPTAAWSAAAFSGTASANVTTSPRPSAVKLRAWIVPIPPHPTTATFRSVIVTQPLQTQGSPRLYRTGPISSFQLSPESTSPRRGRGGP